MTAAVRCRRRWHPYLDTPGLPDRVETSGGRRGECGGVYRRGHRIGLVQDPAAHGHLRSDDPQFTSLSLADGPLTVYDLERLRRPPQHVVLSSCGSGLPTVGAGDEVSVLAAALLGLGTRSLVASVLSVPDRAAGPLMLALHRHLYRGMDPAEARARARADVARAAPADRVTAAAFACFGAG